KAKAAVANAQAGLAKAKAADDLARTEETIALNLRKMDAGAISTLRVTQAQQKRKEADAARKQAQTGVSEAQAAQQQAEAALRQAQAAEQQAEAALAEAQAAQQQAEADERQAVFTRTRPANHVLDAVCRLEARPDLLGEASCLHHCPHVRAVVPTPPFRISGGNVSSALNAPACRPSPSVTKKVCPSPPSTPGADA